ncbi:unnamed protein product [Meloidogyne enterolobii]|uniref:Uncharacterized protein n=1 Tax=Meloidogyne enterolobii TaxID=390850 RepID=A0ACB1APF4_MELEN
MDILQEMFFFAFPEQRNSTKGSLQVYLTFACNQPNSLYNVATKLFAYYLGASGEFQLDKITKEGREEGITAMDAVLFRLFDSLIQSKFGDLSLHNITQIYQIILKNCFADSIGRIPDDFYSRPGISILSKFDRPSKCWHFCLPILSHILQQRGHSNLAKMLEQIPFSNEKIGENLEKILINEDAKQLLEISEFVKFVIYWIIASPLKDVQKDFSTQFVYVPANIFWVDSSGFEHFWLYNLDVEEEDSPAEIEEIKQEKEGLKINQNLKSPIKLLNLLFNSSINNSFNIINQELNCLKLLIPNIYSISILALMASENWKLAKEFYLKLFDSTKELPLQNLFMKILYLKILIVERKLKLAFELGIELIKEINNLKEENEDDELIKFPALVISQEPVWVQLENQKHTFLYIQLLLFHICWLSFTKCQRSLSAEMNETTSFLFLTMILLAQSCWKYFGFGIFEHLIEHLNNKKHFHCPELFSYLTEPSLIDQLLALENILFCFDKKGTENNLNFLPPSIIRSQIQEGKINLAAKEVTSFRILNNFLEQNQLKICEII